MNWHELIVDVLLISLAGFAILQLARTTWHAQNRAAEGDRLLKQVILAQQPSTAPIAPMLTPQPPMAPTRPNLAGFELHRLDQEQLDDLNAP